MKKILLAFFGMVFFAHLSYATYYRLVRTDKFHANLTTDLSNTGSSWTEVRDSYFGANFRSSCWQGGGNGGPDNRINIYCSLVNFDSYSNARSFQFWSVSRCTDYVNEVYVQNTVSPSCVISPLNGSGYKVYSIQRPNGWWWDESQGVWAHNVRVREIADSSTIEWENHGDTGSGMDLNSTILTADAWVNIMNNNPVPCRDYYGSNISGKNNRYYKITDMESDTKPYNAIVAANRDQCPTEYNNRAFVEYYSQKYCREAISRNGVAAVAEADGGCKRYVNDRYFTVDFNRRWKKDASTYWGDIRTRKYGSTSYIFQCKRYYNKWSGTRGSGMCMGTYQLDYTDPSGVTAYTEVTGAGRVTSDVTQAHTYELNTHIPANARNRLTCARLNGRTHTSEPGSEKVRCTCNANKFWSSGNCQKYRKDQGLTKTHYCKHVKTYTSGNKTLSTEGVCAWELTSASNTVSSCAGVANGGTDYLKLEDSGRKCQKYHNNN